MKQKNIVIVGLAAVLAGCGGGNAAGLSASQPNSGSVNETSTVIASTTTSSSGATCPVPVEAITTASPGRLLAAQCAQCHGTDGYSRTGIDSLAGESRAELIEEMLEMQTENESEVMHLQAKGYNQEQIIQIAEYFSKLSPDGGGDEDRDDEDRDDEDRDDEDRDDEDRDDEDRDDEDRDDEDRDDEDRDDEDRDDEDKDDD